MRLHSWLTSLYRQLASPTFGTGVRRERRASTATAAAIIERLEPRQMLSEWAVAVGSETRVNTFTTGEQRNPGVARDNAGDYVAVWLSDGQDGSGYGIYAQRYNAAGTARGGEFKVNTYTTGNQGGLTPVSVAMDAAGDFVIVWESAKQDGSSKGIYAQRYNAAGTAQGGEFKVNTYTTNDQDSPSVAMDGAGDFVITWESYRQNGKGDSIYAQRYSAAGTAQGGEFLVNTHTTSGLDAAVAMDAAGDFVITYEGWDGRGIVIYAQRYNAAGAAQGGEFQVNTYTTGTLSRPSMAMDPGGDFVIAWTSYSQDGYVSDVYAQRYNAAGTAQGGEFKVNTYTTNRQSHPSVAMDAAAEFVITWQSLDQNGFGYGIYAQCYDGAGTAQGAEFRVNTYTSGHGSPSVAMDRAGNFVVAWQSFPQDGSGDGIYSQRYTTDVAPLLSQIETTPLDTVGFLYFPVTSSLLVADPDSDNLTGATIQIADNYQIGQDHLGFANTAKITGSWDYSTGTLTLTGIDSVSNYRVALRNVTYHNTSASPNTAATRTITFQATDGVRPSNLVARDLMVHASTASPVLTGVGGTGTYVHGAAPLTVAPSLVVTHPDGLNIASATVSFTNWQGEDRLDFHNSFALQHTFTQDFVAHTATLTIAGDETPDHYTTLLRSVVYSDVAGKPNTSTTRIATFTVSDGKHSASGMRNLDVVVSNDPPLVLVNDSTTLSYKANGPAVAILSKALVSDPDSNNLTRLTVQITSGYQNNASGHDVLSFVNQLGITGSFNTATGMLSLSGTSYVGNYREALRLVKFKTSGSAVSTATRTFTIIGTDDFSPTPASSMAVTRDMTVTS